jgi:hypothetical protein
MPDDRTSLARSLGEFVGHLWKGLTSDVSPEKDTHEVRRSVEEEERDTPEGKVTLRRTTIEEIEIDRE